MNVLALLESWQAFSQMQRNLDWSSDKGQTVHTAKSRSVVTGRRHRGGLFNYTTVPREGAVKPSQQFTPPLRLGATYWQILSLQVRKVSKRHGFTLLVIMKPHQADFQAVASTEIYAERILTKFVIKNKSNIRMSIFLDRARCSSGLFIQ